MPGGMVNNWLLQRKFRMSTLAAVNTIQVGTDNLLTAAFAVLGLGAWAIVLPKLLTAPIWLVGMRWAIAWHRDDGAGSVPNGEILRYASPILASEILAALRFNLDKMLVGSILGLEALGIYYFAFSAGYGLSLVLTSALAAASFPHLADHRLSTTELLARFDKALLGLAVPITVLIGLQSLAVFIYVPLLFGEKWASMTTVVAVLCLSAATKSWHDLGIQLLRAAGLTGYELIGAAAFTVVLLGSLSLGLLYGLLAGVAAMSTATIGMQLAFTVWARRLVVRLYGLQSGTRSAAQAAAVSGAA
jgi:teichuronic acid exporter